MGKCICPYMYCTLQMHFKLHSEAVDRGLGAGREPLRTGRGGERGGRAPTKRAIRIAISMAESWGAIPVAISMAESWGYEGSCNGEES